MKNLILPITPDYCKHWGIWEALRELAQNVLDRESEDKLKYSRIIKYSSDKETFTIGNTNTYLERKTLLLGYTTKMNNKFIGQFGEGYKLSFIVLLRLGLRITVYNGYEIWRPKIVHSYSLDSDVIRFDFEKLKNPSDNLVCKIEGLTPRMYSEFAQNFLLDSYPSNIIPSEQGNILKDKEFIGKVFVSGLFICKIQNKKCMHGFDMVPSSVQLDRDRRTVESWNLFWETSKIFANLDDSASKYVSMLIEKNAPEVCDFRHHVNKHSKFYQDLCNLSYKDFIDKHSEKAIPVKNHSEAEFIKKRYNDMIPVIVPETHYISITQSASYQNHYSKLPEKKEVTPYILIQDFLKENKNKIFGTAKKIIVEKLLPQSVNWKIRD